MYTYTHAALGGFVAGIAMRNERQWWPRIAFAIAASIPDALMFMQTAFSLRQNSAHPPIWWNWVEQFTAISHSLIVIAISATIMETVLRKRAYSPRFRRISWWLMGMWLSHPVIDCLTHGRLPFGRYDYLWPIPCNLNRWTGIWEYRIPNTLMPGKIEIGIDIALLAGIALQTISYINRRKSRNPISIIEAAHA